VEVRGRQAAPEDRLFSPVWGDNVAPHRRKERFLLIHKYTFCILL
jgi:hypothetical protein